MRNAEVKIYNAQLTRHFAKFSYVYSVVLIATFSQNRRIDIFLALDWI